MKRLLHLDAYVNREMNDAEADALEEALFAAPDDPDLALIDRIGRDGAVLAEHGTFDVGVTREHIEDLIRAGHKVQVVDAGPPGMGRQTLTFSRDAELVCTALPLGRTDIDRVDVEITVLDYNITKTIKDVIVDPTDGTIYGLCERPLAHLAWTAGGASIARIRQTTGARDVIAEWDILGKVA